MRRYPYETNPIQRFFFAMTPGFRGSIRVNRILRGFRAVNRE
jgi:hypothetical protein